MQVTDYNEKNFKGMEDGNGDDSGESGSFGGQDGTLAFTDFVFVNTERKRSPEEERQLLAQHKESNLGLIEKQKNTRDERNNRKNGKTLGSGGPGQGERNAHFLKHPILGEAPEFDGVDPQVNSDPSIYDAETNSEKKELVYQNQLRLDLQNQPKFNPKPSPF